MPRLHNLTILKKRRKFLRNHSTKAESRLWKELRGKNLEGRKFRRQHSIGPYIVDFYCPAERLVIEVDGVVHDDPDQAIYDASRAAYLQGLDIQILRVRNEEVFDAMPEVLAKISAYMND